MGAVQKTFRRLHRQTERQLRRRGFTLIELLVSMTIIGILITLVTVTLLPIQRKGRDSRRKADVNLFLSGINLFKADFKLYPNSTFYLGNNTTDTGAANSSFNLAADILPCNSLSAGQTKTFASSPANIDNPSSAQLDAASMMPGFTSVNNFLICLKYMDRLVIDPNQAGSAGYQYRVSFDYSDATVTASLENQADPDLATLFNTTVPKRYYQGSKTVRQLDDDSDTYTLNDQFTGTFYTSLSGGSKTDGKYLYQCKLTNRDDRSLSTNDPLPFNSTTGKWIKNTNCQDTGATGLDVVQGY